MTWTLRFVAQLPVVVVESKCVVGRSLACKIKAAGRPHGEGNDGFRVLRTRNVFLGRPRVTNAKMIGGAKLCLCIEKNGRTVIQIKNDASGGRKRERDFSPPPASPTPRCAASKSRACKHRSLGVEREPDDTGCF